LPEEIESDNEFDYSENDFEMLYQAIRKLKEIDKAIILLYLEEKSYAEIGNIVGLSQNTVGVRITRIKSKLKEILDGKIN
jgi:RNA polymerase sigma-70 factor (ECF subfamily)